MVEQHMLMIWFVKSQDGHGFSAKLDLIRKADPKSALYIRLKGWKQSREEART